MTAGHFGLRVGCDLIGNHVRWTLADRGWDRTQGQRSNAVGEVTCALGKGGSLAAQ